MARPANSLLTQADFYQPAEWGAAYDYASITDPYVRKDKIGVHIFHATKPIAAATPPLSFTKSTAKIRQSEAYHIGKGWRGLAYGPVIDQEGRVFLARDWRNYSGAFFGDGDDDGVSENKEAIAIAFLVGTGQPPSQAAWDSFDRVVGLLEGDVGYRLPLRGHFEIQPEKATTCPEGTQGTGIMGELARRNAAPEGPTVINIAGDAVINVAGGVEVRGE